MTYHVTVGIQRPYPKASTGPVGAPDARARPPGSAIIPADRSDPGFTPISRMRPGRAGWQRDRPPSGVPRGSRKHNTPWQPGVGAGWARTRNSPEDPDERQRTTATRWPAPTHGGGHGRSPPTPGQSVS